MEEATDTISVPPFLDSRTLMQFCQAIQQYADHTGRHDQAQERIQKLLANLDRLQALGRLCRFAVLGLPHACEKVRDELECLAVDFPSDPIDCRCYCGCQTTDAESYNGPVQLAAAFDLLAGAAFVAKCDLEARNRFVVAIVRAIEDSICYPLAFAVEAAEYSDGGRSKFPSMQVDAVIATATTRFLEGDTACDPKLPHSVRKRLEQLACKWMRANPVTDLFRALTGPRWEGVLQSISPANVNIGDEVTLTLCLTCADKWGDRDRKGVAALLKDVRILFCPRQPAPIASASGNHILVKVPAGARSGPIAVVREFGSVLLGDIVFLLNRYACEYPVEWSYSIFTLIPMWQWAYPAAFCGPCIKINNVPQQATVSAYSTFGMLGPTSNVRVNELVAIYYRVDPPGSDRQIPVQVTASSGTLSNLGVPGAIGFTASSPGDVTIKLSWGALTSTLTLHVVRTLGGP